ncbi:MAG: 50S ribosome-binding GTPase [Pirellulales bacterium]|nr:50S ribosome-binding GTPase [Pirellulales bacterium]
MWRRLRKLRPLARWVLLAGIWVLPYLGVFVAGWIWLYERGWILWWVGATAALCLAAWGANAWWDRRQRGRPLADVNESPRWPPEGKAAWQEVVRLAEQARREEWPVAQAEDWLHILRSTLEVVARRFHPESSEPLLEVRIPHLLRVVECVAADLRHTLTQDVPGAHVLTLHQMLEAHRWWQRGQQWYSTVYPLYQIGRLLTNPSAGLIREAGAAMAAGVWRQSVRDVRAWLVDYTIKKAGYHAICLYSGQLVLDEGLAGVLPPPSADDLREEAERERAIAEEPLRVVVLGKVKAGKSSLVNALFGQTKAAVDVLPTTVEATAYRYEQPGRPPALVIDTAGFALDARAGPGGMRPAAWQRELAEQIERCDLVLLVLSAVDAARDPERQMLARVRELCGQRARRAPPVVVAVVTHIDLLRPWSEWSPPYDLRAAAPGSKAASIAAAVEAAAHDLGLSAEQVVPVSLQEGAVYNIEACLAAIAAAAPEAERARYLRAFEAYARREVRALFWKQVRSGGRMLVGKAAAAVEAWLRRLVVSGDHASALDEPEETAPPSMPGSLSDRPVADDQT